MWLRKAFFGFSVALIGLYFSVGLVWTGLNLKDVPHYGDTATYLKAAQNLEVDEYRGIVYPVFLNLAGRCCLASGLPRTPGWRHKPSVPCTVSAELVWIQLFQIAAFALALVYFLFVMVGGESDGSRRSRYRLLLLGALLLFDPLIHHFNLALMTDGLALSFSLVFCAALADLACRRTRPWLAGTMLYISYVLASGLRIEKKWVLLGTLVLVVAIWAVLRRRGVVGFEFPFKTALVIGGLGFVTVTALFAVAVKPKIQWSRWDMFIHHRLGFPHGLKVYEHLPDRAKALLPREELLKCQRKLLCYQKTIKTATEGRPELHEQLTRDLAETVFRWRWHVIATGMVRDTVENFFATASFHGRATVKRLAGAKIYNSLFGPGGDRWILSRMLMHHPRASLIYLRLSKVLLAFSSAIAVFGLWHFVRRRGWREQPVLVVLWAPAVLFCLLNAGLFAIVQDIVQLRFTLGAHALFLVLVYYQLVRWMAPRQPSL